MLTSPPLSLMLTQQPSLWAMTVTRWWWRCYGQHGCSVSRFRPSALLLRSYNNGSVSDFRPLSLSSMLPSPSIPPFTRFSIGRKMSHHHWHGSVTTGLRWSTTNATLITTVPALKHNRSTIHAGIGKEARRNLSSKNDSNNQNDNNDLTAAYLSSLGYDDERVQEGMRNALRGVFGKDITVAHLKSLGNEGLKALAKSVQHELSLTHTSSSTSTVTVRIKIPHHKSSFTLNIPEHQTFHQFLTQPSTNTSERELLSEYLECSCGGTMSCSTCHIILDPESYNRLPPPIEAEMDILDLAYEATETSRLGCCVVVTKELEGMVVTIPGGVVDLWS